MRTIIGRHDCDYKSKAHIYAIGGFLLGILTALLLS